MLSLMLHGGIPSDLQFLTCSLQLHVDIFSTSYNIET